MDDFFAVLRPEETIIGLIYDLLSFFNDEEVIAELFDKIGIRRATVVVDTNILLSDLKYCVQKKHHTSLMVTAKFGGMRLFASTIVRDEVPEKLCIYMSKYGIDPQEAQQIWQTYYVPWISFLDPSELPLLSQRIVNLLARDPDDVPTGQIIELLGPHLVLSKDKDLAAFESTGQDIPIITCAYRDKARGEITSLSISIGSGFVLQVSSEAVESLLTFVSRLDKKLSIGLLCMAIGSLGAALFYAPSRKWLREKGILTIKSIWRVIKPILDELVEIELASAKAELVISQPLRNITVPKTARGYAVKVLSEAYGPLGAREITRRMIVQGYNTRSEHPEYYISSLLHKYPRLFEKTEGKRWHLKSHLPDLSEEAV